MLYDTRAWYDARQQALHDTDWTCSRCGDSLIGAGRGAHVHHIKALRRAPVLGTEPLNLKPLCRRCHALVHAAEAAPMVALDGSPTDASHPWNSGIVRQHGFGIPVGLRPAGIPVTLVCGPPASGKSTFVAQ